MSLTDDWKAGKLEDGLYYIRLEDDKTPIASKKQRNMRAA